VPPLTERSNNKMKNKNKDNSQNELMFLIQLNVLRDMSIFLLKQEARIRKQAKKLKIKLP
jgi:hypothetical protein